MPRHRRLVHNSPGQDLEGYIEQRSCHVERVGREVGCVRDAIRSVREGSFDNTCCQHAKARPAMLRRLQTLWPRLQGQRQTGIGRRQRPQVSRPRWVWVECGLGGAIVSSASWKHRRKRLRGHGKPAARWWGHVPILPMPLRICGVIGVGGRCRPCSRRRGARRTSLTRTGVGRVRRSAPWSSGGAMRPSTLPWTLWGGRAAGRRSLFGATRRFGPEPRRGSSYYPSPGTCEVTPANKRPRREDASAARCVSATRTPLQ